MIVNRAGRRAAPRSWVAVAALVALAAAGCTATNPPTVTTLRVTLTDDWVTPPVLDAVRDFEATHPHVRVVVDKAPIKGMLDMVKGSPSPPDVVQSHAFSAAAQGLAQPLDDLWDKSLKPEEFFQGALDDVTLNGHRYGVPLDTNALVLLYNADQFRAAGVPLPTGPMTFDQVAAAAQALTTPDGSQRAMALGTSTWQTFGWVSANGGEYVDVGADGRPQFLFDSPQVVARSDSWPGWSTPGWPSRLRRPTCTRATCSPCSSRGRSPCTRAARGTWSTCARPGRGSTSGPRQCPSGPAARRRRPWAAAACSCPRAPATASWPSTS